LDVAVNVAVVDPAATITFDGTVTFALSLAMSTFAPPFNAALSSDTEQVAGVSATSVVGEHVKALTAAPPEITTVAF
jgi:hypothetical protein